MPKDTIVDLAQKAFEKDMKVLQRVFEADFVPLLKQKAKLERKEFEKAFTEVEKLEREL